MKALRIFVLLFFPALVFAQQDFTRYVDPFIGTGGHGHTFPGATRPFGMVQLSPDTRLTGWDGCSGYHYSDSIIYGFSHTHLSGTGISDYGDILLMPTVGEVFLNALDNGSPEKGYASRFQHRFEKASPGFYSVRLDDDDIFVELTATARAGLHRYSFPATDKANIILDLTHRDEVLDSGLRVAGPNVVVGWRRSKGWAKDQIVYFAIEFSHPLSSFGIAIDDKLMPDLREARGRNVKAYFRFDTRRTQQVLARVGISAVDTNGALLNLAAELGHKSFETVKAEAAVEWNTALNKIAVSGGNHEQLTTFYTALYHAMLAPNLFSDVDGRYRGRDFKIHQTNDFANYTVFSLWDTFRAAHPLYALIDQKRTRDFIRTFLAQYEQGGRLPVWELAANETDTMIGYHAVSVIADAAAKEIGGFDLQEAFVAMKHSAELRERGLGAYIDKGFIAVEDERESVSKVLEYAYDDWCIAQVARRLGRNDDYQCYLGRAQSYKNLFDRQSGFMRPRSNGNWLEPFDPREVTFAFTEANSWQYTFFAPQDVTGLMQLMGGAHAFAHKLDQLFAAESKTTGREQADITGLIGQYAHGNEPSHHMAYLYDYAGEPWKTQMRVREIMDQFYKAAPDGLIGNEDCGQMSAWYVFSAAGFYPVTPGSTIYAIGSPLFPEVRFRFENGKSLVITAKNLSQQNVYIQSATLNGKRYEKSYLEHSDVVAGGELVFEMGPRPNRSWGGRLVPVAEIRDSEIIPIPVIRSASKTFRTSTTVSIRSLQPGDALHYTTDGSEPSPNSRRFMKPFMIDRDTTVRAIAIGARGNRSKIVSAEFHRMLHDWKLTLLSDYSSQYSGGGENALIDGLRGTTNWTSGTWQGYWEKDLVALVDLGKVQTISKAGAGFLQDIGSWIWFPRRVEIELSLDGKNFTRVAAIETDLTQDRDGVSVKDFSQSFTPQNARYVHLRAINSGQNTWLFSDEVLIEN